MTDADAGRVAELAEGRDAVDALAVERGRADEPARESTEHDARLPHELAAPVPRRPVENVVRAVLPADADPQTLADVDDVGRRPEVEIAGVGLAGAVRPPQPSARRT